MRKKANSNTMRKNEIMKKPEYKRYEKIVAQSMKIPYIKNKYIYTPGEKFKHTKKTMKLYNAIHN